MFYSISLKSLHKTTRPQDHKITRPQNHNLSTNLIVLRTCTLPKAFVWNLKSDYMTSWLRDLVRCVSFYTIRFTSQRIVTKIFPASNTANTSTYLQTRSNIWQVSFLNSKLEQYWLPVSDLLCNRFYGNTATATMKMNVNFISSSQSVKVQLLWSE